MTAPTIEVKNGTELSGMGLALVGTTVEQDAAYVSCWVRTLFGFDPCEFLYHLSHPLVVAICSGNVTLKYPTMTREPHTK